MSYWSEFSYPKVRLGVALVAVALVAVWLFMPIRIDEWWGYGVIKQVTNGEKLYGDVFFGSTPLSVLLGSTSLELRMPDLLALRLMTTASCAVVMIATDYMLFRCGVVRYTRLAVALMLAVLFVPACQWQIYAGLALGTAFLAIVLFEALGRTPIYATIAGVLAGLSVSTKYNVGVVALLALLVVAWLTSAKTARLKTAARIAAGAICSILVATVVPVLLLGDSGEFVNQVLDKRAYGATGSTSPLLGLTELGGRIQDLDFFGALANPSFGFLVLAIVVVVLNLRAIRRGGSRAIVIIALLACSIAVTFPRTDAIHVNQALPGLVLAIVALPALAGRPRESPVGRVVGAAILAVVVVAAVGQAVVDDHEARQIERDRRPEVGPTAPDPSGHFARLAAEDIRRHTNEPVLFISWVAAPAYAAGALTNPTRYDYPMASAFPAQAQEQTITDLAQGSLTWVCISPDLASGIDPLAPTELIRWVESHMKLVEKVRGCDLYRVKPR